MQKVETSGCSHRRCPMPGQNNYRGLRRAIIGTMPAPNKWMDDDAIKLSLSIEVGGGMNGDGAPLRRLAVVCQGANTQAGISATPMQHPALDRGRRRYQRSGATVNGCVPAPLFDGCKDDAFVDRFFFLKSKTDITFESIILPCLNLPILISRFPRNYRIPKPVSLQLQRSQ